MSIDHEAAKNVCHARLAQDMHPSSSDRNIARAYLDLHAQLEAKERRIEALVELVHECAELFKLQRPKVTRFILNELARIMEDD